MDKKLPDIRELTEAVYKISLGQMRILAIMRSVYENYQEEIPPEARAQIERYLNESFEDADKINSSFGEYNW